MSTPSMPSEKWPPPGGVGICNVRRRRTHGVWTAMTSLTVLTALTADIVDEVDLIGAQCQQRQLGQSCPPSTQSILSTPSMPSEKWPPPGGVGICNVRRRRTHGVWTAMTSLTVLTALTADIVDEVDLIGALCQQRQLGQSCPPSTQSILSTPSVPSSKPPPAGGGLVVVKKNFGIFRELGCNWRIFLKQGSI